MSLAFLADTNVLSEPLRPRPDAGVLARLREHAAAVGTAAPVWHELWFGVSRLPASRRRRQLQAFLEDVAARGVPVLPYDAAAAQWHGQERARLASEGRTPPFVDGQIAAVAVTRGLVLVTANVRDYEGFEGLRVEDWRTAG